MKKTSNLKKDCIRYVIITTIIFIILVALTTFLSITLTECEPGSGEFDFCFAPLKAVVESMVGDVILILIWMVYYSYKIKKRYLEKFEKSVIFKYILISSAILILIMSPTIIFIALMLIFKLKKVLDYLVLLFCQSINIK